MNNQFDKGPKPLRCSDCGKEFEDEWVYHCWFSQTEYILTCKSCLDKGLSVDSIMSEYGRRGGKIGGVNRAKILTPKRRKQIAKLAAEKRWAFKTRLTDEQQL